MIVYSPGEFGNMVKREMLFGADRSHLEWAAAETVGEAFCDDVTSLPDYAYARVSWHYASANTPDEIAREEAVDVVKSALYRLNMEGLLERAVRAELELRDYKLVEEE